MGKYQQLQGGRADAREKFGVTVTFRADGDDRLTVHRTGQTLKALRECCAIALARNDRYRIVCISTPQSIYSDVLGRMPHGKSGQVENPDIGTASRAGLVALVHPSLLGRSRQAKTRHLSERPSAA